MPTALIRVTVRRVVEEIAQIEVREEDASRAAAFVNADLASRRPLLTPEWQATGAVVEIPHVVATEAAA